MLASNSLYILFRETFSPYQGYLQSNAIENPDNYKFFHTTRGSVKLLD